MKKVLILLSVLSFFLSAINAQTSSASTGTGTPFNQQSADIANWLNAHNAVRKCYGQPPLTWDTNLAAASASYAQQCMINPLTHSNPNGAYGENLSTYMAIPQPSVTPYKSCDWHVTQGWYPEEKNWNCSTNTCNTAGGAMCGHLTQVIWSATTAVGCGVAFCTLNSGGKTWFVQNAVCRYTPPGNYVGQNPCGTVKCPSQPTTLGPLTPSPPYAPVTAPTPIAAPVTPPKAAPVTAPVTAPTKTPVSPTKTPVAPTPVLQPVPVPVPVAVTPAPAATGTWWSKCICNYWPKNAAGQQYQDLTPCCWEPWQDTSSPPTTWCCPNCQNQWDYCWPIYNLGAKGDTTAACPYGVAPVSSAVSESTAKTMGGLTESAWIGIGVGIAVLIIIVIVVVIIVHKKKNSETV